MMACGESSVSSTSNKTARVVARSTEKKEKSSNRYVQTVKSRRHEENGSVNIFTSREFYTVFVLVSLAKQKGAS